MATAIAQLHAPNVFSSFFKSAWAMFVWLGENTARARMVREISAMSDAQLEARGLTRYDLVQRVFVDGYSK